MKYIPILMCGKMVEAILDGRKTQTRRIVNWKALFKKSGLSNVQKSKLAFFKVINDWGLDVGDGTMYQVGCPYGKVGDRLWVKETFTNADFTNKQVFYRADYRQDKTTKKEMSEVVTWKPSIFMPRWASRITLEIISIRVERLNEISEKDAKAEGVSWYPALKPIPLYQEIWEFINGVGSWAKNPWVWVIEFKRV